LNGRAILVVSVAAVLFLAAVPALTMASTPSFTVVSAQWGTTAKPVEAQPGSTDIPLTVTLQFTGSLEAKTVQGALQLAAAAIDQQVVGGLTDVYGNTTTTAFAGSITTDATFSLTYYLDVTSNAHTGVFSIPLEIYWTDSSSGTGYYSQTTSIGVPILGIPTIVFGATQTPLAPGKVNNVSLTIGNEGSGPPPSSSFHFRHRARAHWNRRSSSPTSVRASRSRSQSGCTSQPGPQALN